jgi:hypothetical protein
MECLRNSQFFRRRALIAVGIVALAMTVSPSAMATLTGTMPVTPGTQVFPGLITPGTDPGTLLASMDAPWTFSTTAGTTSGQLYSAVFQEMGGTLDFYYQVLNDGNSATSLERESSTNFIGYSNPAFVGYWLDGSTLPTTCTNSPCQVSAWQTGDVAPSTADVSPDGSTVGFNFCSGTGCNGRILQGQSSSVLVISTTATSYSLGNAELLDGGSVTVAAFQPAPEPASLALIGGGLLLLAGFRKAVKKH